MKCCILLFAIGGLNLISISTYAQSTIWANSIGNNNYNNVPADLAVDQFGNVYVTGGLSSLAYCDEQFLGVQGSWDAFLAKFNGTTGELIWSQRAGGSFFGEWGGFDFAYEVLVDTVEQAVYYCGRVYGTPASIGSCHSLSGFSGFLSKYDYNGNCVWVRTSNKGLYRSMVLDPSGELIVAGQGSDVYSDSVIFSDEPLIQVPNGPFIVRYDPSGEVVMAKGLGKGSVGSLELSNDTLYMSTAQHPGIITAYLGDTLSDVSTYTPILMGMNAHADSIYFQWRLLNTDIAIIHRPLVSDEGIYIVGHAKGDLYLPHDTISFTIEKPFIFKLSRIGEIADDFPFNTNVTVRAPRLATLDDGNLLYSCIAQGPITFGGITVTPGTWGNGLGNFLLIKMDQEGEVLNLTTHGTARGSSSAMAVTPDGSVAYACEFTGTMDLGTLSLTGVGDIMVAKFSLPTSIAPKFNNSGQLLIYANPNAGTCTIELPQQLARERDLWLRIYDSSGNLVQQSRLAMEQDLIKLDITAQARGSYLAEVGNGRVKYTGMIVFE